MKIEMWNGHNIRFVEKDGEWWAVAADVADALEFSRTADMGRMVDDADKGAHKVRTTSDKPKCPNTQDMLIISEFGIYQCVFNSHKLEAKQFKRWVYSMLKELRKQTGLEGFEVFRMLDKAHQREAMKQLSAAICQTRPPIRVDFIKANCIANKAVSNRHGYTKMVKKSDMSPSCL
jgi:prophage antirepressor-like protein